MGRKEEGEESGASATDDSDSGEGSGGGEAGGEGPTAAAPAPPSAQAKTEEKKKDEIRKTLSAHPTPEDKLEALLGKHAVTSEEAALAKKNLKSARKATGAVMRERDFLKAELEKSMVGKAKLEGLCRELQKTNKTIKQENLRALREQEAKRKELSDQFKASLAEIEKGMGSGKERSECLYKENQRLALQLDALAEKYAAKEEQGDKLVEMREAKAALLEAKLGQAQARLDALAAESIGDKEKLIKKLQERESQMTSMIDVEEGLRKQLEDYGQRYADFQSNLTSSNDAFAKFQEQMDEMSGQLSAANDHNTGLQKELKDHIAKTSTFEKLTRALQEERVSLLKQVADLKAAQAPAPQAPPPATAPQAPQAKAPQAPAAAAKTAAAQPPAGACCGKCPGDQPKAKTKGKGKAK